MDGAGVVAIIGLIGLLIGNVVTYIVARRNKSGRIISSEAESLWQESSRIRADLMSQIESLRKELWAVRARASECEERLRKFSEWTRG